MVFPPVPPQIKSVAHILKVADEHENRNIVVTYWARMYACQSTMKLNPGKKPPEVTNLLLALMDWLEATKKTSHDVEGISNETVASAMIEQYAMQLFTFADSQDRAENFNKNMIKAFYTAGILMDILEQFGEQSEDIIEKKKYAKWKAAYIHNCLKSGDIPTAGGPDEHLKNVIDITKGDDESSQNDLVISPHSNRDFPNGPGYNLPTGPAPASSPVTPVVPTEPQPFTPQTEPATPSSSTPTPAPRSPNAYNPGPEQIQKAQKYCKYATSALNYDDVKTAVENLTKALNLLKSGTE